VSEEQISTYLRALRGKDRDDAYHRLIELGAAVIPSVVESFVSESEPSIRTTLVNIAWRTNSTDVIPFLKVALDDLEAAVWKEALDGLIALGGQSALDVVLQARKATNNEKAEWLDEAVQQIADGMSKAERGGT
jgi:hypothetical protein